MKNIIILCDGTWNFADARYPTNVVKLAEAIDGLSPSGVAQRLFYDPGIGSKGSRVRRWFDGATGTGISENIIQSYTFLVHNYEVGDQLYLFGFSRGAFTVRSLAGLIRTAGILERSAASKIKEAYALYRSRDPLTFPHQVGPKLFRRTYAVQDITPIHFIGVWDTVGSLGNPVYFNLSPRNRFHDTGLSGHVTHAYQAIAINELRKNFTPTLWYQNENAVGQQLEQRWFVGAHSDVGGGRPNAALSNIPLDWMIKKATHAGLSVASPRLDLDPFGPIHESRSGAYRLIRENFRPIGLDEINEETGVPMKTYQCIDDSVIARRKADASYRPSNLEEYLQRHG